MFFKSATDFERALHWLFRALVKNQRHPVAGWNFNQAAGGFSLLNLLGRTNGLSQFINRRALLVNRKLGIANDIDEQDMRDLELDLFLDLNGHGRGKPPIRSGQLFAFRLRRSRRKARQRLSFSLISVRRELSSAAR